MGMKINIENCAEGLKTKDQFMDGRIYAIIEMIGNLKELRDRTRQGDLDALDEFFNLYQFNGGN